MSAFVREQLLRWAAAVPVLAIVVLVFTWGRSLPGFVIAVVVVLLAGAVLAAVHHAEVVAHRVGELFGSLILAVAVTIIEVGMIIALTIGGGAKTQTLARDTVFAAVMVTCNGIVGLALLIGALRRHVTAFNAEGAGAALATVVTLATLSLVVPTFTTTHPGPQFTPAQLAFASVVSLAMYGLFVLVQTRRHRDYFLPVATEDDIVNVDEESEPPPIGAALVSLVLLVVALIAVVGDAKIVSPAIEAGVEAAELPQSVVGVVIALLVLLPETLAAARAAQRDRVQISLNLALGSAMASIGLTIPAISVASIWIHQPLVLGLGGTQMVLLALTGIVGVLTVLPGRATLMQAGIHLLVFAAYLFLAASP
ncbi:calcium:proton antiporter [Dactylosporangium sp. NPDC048998]|uniref:calcium:proton antiporter n=1 Tax=Dactylosporangium sp. NPDC048998 TaxID=3363976 RepID=UPI00371A0282